MADLLDRSSMLDQSEFFELNLSSATRVRANFRMLSPIG